MQTVKINDVRRVRDFLVCSAVSCMTSAFREFWHSQIDRNLPTIANEFARALWAHYACNVFVFVCEVTMILGKSVVGLKVTACQQILSWVMSL